VPHQLTPAKAPEAPHIASEAPTHTPGKTSGIDKYACVPNSVLPKENPGHAPTHPLPCCRHTIVNGDEQLVIETASGRRITLQQSSASVLIEDANGNTIRLEPAGITIMSAAKVVVSSTQVEINASTVTVNAGMTKFSGVVQTDTLIANSVVASSYTPGAGNIW
jgi:hypothetical protein